MKVYEKGTKFAITGTTDEFIEAHFGKSWWGSFEYFKYGEIVDDNYYTHGPAHVIEFHKKEGGVGLTKLTVTKELLNIWVEDGLFTEYGKEKNIKQDCACMLCGHKL